MKWLWFVLCVLVLAIAPTRARASVELADVLKSVERHHPLLVASTKDVAQAEGDLLSARGSFDPSISARASMQAIGAYSQSQLDVQATQYTGLWGSNIFAGYRFGDDMPSYYGDRLTKMGGELRAGINVPLWRNGPIDRARAGIARSERNVEMAELGVVQQRIQLQRDASYRYWEWVSAVHRKRVAESLLAIATARDSAIQARVARGDLPAIEQTDNARLVAARKGLVVSAERLLTQATIELSLFHRTVGGDPILIDASQAPNLPEPIPTNALDARAAELALERRPEVRRLSALEQGQRIDVDLARNQRAPAIDAFAMGSIDIGDPRRDANGVVVRSDLDKPVLAIGLVIDIPIPNRAALGKQRAAEAALDKTREQKQFAADRIRADVADARSAVDAAFERVRIARQELALAQTLERAEQARFDAGDSTILVVNMREQATAESRVREIDALADHGRALAQFRAATGSL